MLEINGESKIRKILFNEISLLLGVVAMVLSGFIYLTNPYKDVSMEIQAMKIQIESQSKLSDQLTQIKNNDMVELKEGQKRLEDRQMELIKAVARLEALLK